jgi:DNA-binding transcriptional LysR family regulator
MEPLERGDVDFQIVPDHLVLRQHPHELLFSDDFVCVIWTGNRLVGEQLSMSQYLSLGHVALSFPRRHHGDDEWVKSMAHVDRRIDIIAINFASLPQYVVGTQRIATVQRRLAALYARHFPVRFLAAPFEIPRLNEMLQWNQNFDADPSHRWFRGILKDVAAEIGTG